MGQRSDNQNKSRRACPACPERSRRELVEGGEGPRGLLEQENRPNNDNALGANLRLCVTVEILRF